MSELIDRLRQRLTDPEKIVGRAGEIESRVFPPATEKVVQDAEKNLGFVLPETLRSIYLNVANGGVGPSLGLLGITGGATDDQGRNAIELLDQFLDWNNYQGEDDPEEGWSWPSKVLPICYRGCTVYECLDCGVPEPPVSVVDISDQDWEKPFEQTSSSLRSWLEEWLDETDGPEPQWLKRFDDGQDFQTITWASFGGEMFASQMPYLARFKNLTGLGLNGRRVTDEHLIHLTQLPQLSALHLHGTGISNDGLRHVSALDNLRHLLIGETRISDPGLVHLKGLPLESLDLSYTSITDEGLKHLYALKSLKDLNLTSVPVSESGLAALGAALPDCEVEWWPQE